MRIYLSGPMTGRIDNNFPAFRRVAAELRKAGYEVVDPSELNVGLPEPDRQAQPLEWEAFWHACLRKDLRALMDCEAIALMRGWEQSKGAQLEQHVAHRVGLHVLFVEDLIVEP